MANASQFEAHTGEPVHAPAVNGSNGHKVKDESSTAVEGAGAGTSALEETYVFPASREQTRYWMLAQLDPESTASNMAIAFEIEGEVEEKLVEKAVALLTMRHEALRTVFRLEAGILSQVVVARPLYRFTREDLSSADAQQQAALLETSVSRHGHTVIDLEAGPVLHAHLIRLNRQRHVMALTMNHIVCDGWSNGILIRDFTLIYDSLQSGNEAALPELPFQFADFSLWQNEYLTSPPADEAAAFWKAHITSDLSALDMPTDHPRPSGRSFPGHIESELLPKAIDDRLKAYCRETGSTKHIVLLAAFEALCATYTGQKQFLLGSTIANRTQPGMEDVVGRFANPQIIVAKVDGDPSFAQLEQRVRDWETAAYTHQDLPFSRIIEDFQMDQAGATSQFLQVWFLYQKAFMQPQTGRNIRVTPRRSVSGGVDFDLLVSVVERAEGPRIQFEYNTLIFEPTRIRGLIDSFIVLLGAALERPTVPLSQLAQVTSATRPAVQAVAANAVTAKARVAAGDNAGAGFLSTFRRHLAARPDAVAVADERVALTWREVEAQSSAVAAAVRRKHPETFTLVIHLSPLAESAVALLAALKLGVRIAPLPAQTDARAAAPYLATLPNALLLAPMKVGASGEFAFENFAALPAAEDNNVVSEDYGNFLFVDDATFVEVSSKDVFRSVTATVSSIPVNEDASILSFPVHAGLDACLDLLIGLVSGAQLNFATLPQTGQVEVGSFAGQIADHEVSCILVTPAQAKSMASSGWRGDRRIALVVRGGRLPASLATMLTVRLKSTIYLVASLEAGGFAAMQNLTGERAAQGLLPIGGESVMLTDSEGRGLPAGAFGEVTLDDGRRTGYMARSSSSGVIELSDRADRFVQLRGHRVCLGDIEDAAFVLPSVRDAYVSVMDAEGDGGLVLYVLSATEDRDGAALRRHFSRTLPSHLAPSEIIYVDSLTYSADGRVDIRQLPKREHHVTETHVESATLPLNEVQQKLAAIWKDVLGLKSVDIRSTFFELGGGSLLLVRLFARINKTFDTSLPITTIFDAQTIEALSIVLGGETEISHLVHVQTSGARPPLFMIHSYLLYQGLSTSLGPEQPFYGLRELEEDGQMGIEERVARYVSEIRHVQPHGPYHLAGWCAAGPLTVEVARQLLQAGEAVNYLALFDSWRPGYFETTEAALASQSWARFRSIGSKLRYHRYRLRGLPLSKKAVYVWMNVTRLTTEARNRFYLRNWRRLRRLSEKYRFELPQFMHNTSFETFSALKDYQGERVPVRLTLIRASESREVAGASASCGWEQIAEHGVDVLWAPGDHESMFRGENLKVTSEIVRRGLASAAIAGAQNSDAPGSGHLAGMRVLHVDCPST
jgi:thioesterase domain-containing protein/non-ribosomal peptide synthetase component F/acyl carrier protein